MTESALRLKDEMLRLPEEDREELARLLWDSLDDGCDEMDEIGWIAELERRSADVEAGRATVEPFRQAIEELRREKP
jgi:putative addiction module component (TIGR02574 family)